MIRLANKNKRDFKMIGINRHLELVDDRNWERERRYYAIQYERESALTLFHYKTQKRGYKKIESLKEFESVGESLQWAKKELRMTIYKSMENRDISIIPLP